MQAVSYTDDHGRKALTNADLVVEAGETICLVGASPTDLAAVAGLLVGLYRPDRGVVTVGPHEPANLSPTDTRSLVTLVPNDPWIIADDTIHDNIAFGAQSVTRATTRGVLADLLLRQWPPDRPGALGSRAENLSTLDRRLLALARAVATDPGLVVIEQPTVGLSPDGEQQMLRAVDRACRGRTAVVVSNRMSVARRVDRVVVAERGQFVPYDRNDPHHERIWERRIPPTTEGRPRRPTLRLVGPNDRPATPPRTGPWGITPGEEMAPDLVASGLLGRNADTELWTAWDRTNMTMVRVRVPRLRPVTYRAWEQLSRERRVVRALSGHPGVARADRADLHCDLPFAVYEYLDSPSLVSTLLPHGQGLSPLEALAVAFDLAETLAHLHRRGFVHLDLRAGNIRLRDGRAVLTDLAQARPTGSALPPGLSGGPTPTADHHQVAHPAMDLRAFGTLLARLAPATGWPQDRDKIDRLVEQLQATDPAARPTAEEVVDLLGPLAPPRSTTPAEARARRHLRLVSGGA